MNGEPLTIFLFIPMAKPIHSYRFHAIEGMWRDGNTGIILADLLLMYDLLIDDKCEFARMKDYERNISIWYRRPSNGLITIEIWQLH